ncbi:MAG: sigma 54-interacting transcriptional regulator [Myxococcales bacterium]|nr:sigma 54-interacting transcriptional regulator [Myxococcales bacterium]
MSIKPRAPTDATEKDAAPTIVPRPPGEVLVLPAPPAGSSPHDPPVAGAPSLRRVTELSMPSGEVRRIRKLRVTLVSQPDPKAETKSYSFAQDEVRVGSSPAMDVVLTDPKVSRDHLAVRLSEEGFVVTDRGSKNGTFVGTMRLRQVVVSDALTLRLGDTVLRLEPLAEHVEHEISHTSRFGRMLGESPPMREMFAVLEKVAQSELTVLVEGETGTGKELAAEGLHEASGRSGPFVTLNCGAIPRELIESELMGHVAGAFTGAVRDRPGAFVAADGGTLFLDEVGELPIDMQAKALRVLERHEVKPVGSDRSRTVDVRVVAATNRSLAREVEAGTFRQDLYYRLAVVVVKIPPLRTRMQDLPLLVAHIQEELGRRRAASGLPPLAPLDPNALAMLKRYDFPGNVRELRNLVERWNVLGTSVGPGEPTVRSSTGEHRASADEALLTLPYHEAKEAWVERFERAYVSAALERCEGNVSHAARDAGVDRRHLQRLMSRYGIKGPKGG